MAYTGLSSARATRRAPRGALAATLAFAVAALAGAALPTATEAQLSVSEFAPDVACVTPPTPSTAAIAYNAGIASACPPSSNPRVRDLRVLSPAMGTEYVWARVILPASYSTSPTKKYPVLYLLTGHGAGYQSWSCSSFIERYVANADVIVVMPDGSRSYDRCSAHPDSIGDSALPGAYSDWLHTSADGNPERWETFHISELKTILENNYRSNKVYAVAGLSMGGLGSMKYAASHRDVFSAAAEYSGLVNTVSAPGFAAVNGSMIAAGQDTNAIWGYYPGTPGAALFGTRWPANNPSDLAAQLKGLPLFISSGDGTQGHLVSSYDAALGVIEAGAKSMSGDFVNRLKTVYSGTLPSNVTVQYYAGIHQWAYWDAELCRSLPMLMSALGVTGFANPLACNIP